jgi:hypothetical protein
VPHDPGIGQEGLVAAVDVIIGAAQADTPDPDLYLTVRRDRRRPIDHLEPQGFPAQDGTHD